MSEVVCTCVCGGSVSEVVCTCVCVGLALGLETVYVRMNDVCMCVRCSA